MELHDRANDACCCNKNCSDCKGFQKIVYLKNAGLTIYRYTTRTKDNIASNTLEDVFILHNTKDVDIRPDEVENELIELNKVNCLLCKKIYEHAQRLMQKVPSINKSNIIGICDHCKVINDRFHRSCNECKDIVRKFIISKGDRLEKSKQRVLIWLSNMKCSQNESKEMNSPTHTELFIDKLNEKSSRLTREPEITQIFVPTHQFGSTDSSFTKTQWSNDFRKDNVMNSVDANRHSTTEEDKTWLDIMDHNKAWKLNNLYKQRSNEPVPLTCCSQNIKHTIYTDVEKTLKLNISKYNSEGIIRGSIAGVNNISRKDFSFLFLKENKPDENTKVIIKKVKNTHYLLKTEVRETNTNEQLKINTADIKKIITGQKEKGKHLIDEKNRSLKKDCNERSEKKQQHSANEKKQDLEKNSLTENKNQVQKYGSTKDKKEHAVIEKNRFTEKTNTLSSEGFSQQKESKENNNLSAGNQFKSSKTKETIKIEKIKSKKDKISSSRSATDEHTLKNSNQFDKSQNPEQVLNKQELEEQILSAKYFKQAAERKGKEKESRSKNIPKSATTSEKLVHNNNKSDNLLKRLVQLKNSNVTDITSTSSDVSTNEQIKNSKTNTVAEIIIGQSILKYKPSSNLKKADQVGKPILFQSGYQEVMSTEQNNMIETKNIKLKPSSTKDAKPTVQVPKGIVRFALSDRSFIDKGWTILPTEKVVRKMNVYRMRPAHPDFDWFNNNRNKGIMQYDTGGKLAEFEESGRGRWFYRNGQLALDYYDAKEENAQQRFVVYSSGEPDERGRSHPITILASFDYLGNGIVFDHGGKIRLKYNQTEGVVLDREIGPVSHWKWHSLNDPPVLQQVMIDSQMPHKDPAILNFGEPADDIPRTDNEEMLEIEFDNFIKEKSRKLSQTFKPFQIKMKALKINKYFSLRVLDQGNIYLIFRDGLINLKLNVGMLLDHHEIIDTDTAELGEVSNNLERLPAHTDSLATLQRSIANAQRFQRSRMERERRHVRPSEVCRSADQLTAAASRPLRTALYGSKTAAEDYCKCNRKPSNNLYYKTCII